MRVLWQQEGAPQSSALLLRQLKIRLQTKAHFWFNFAPVLSVIVQKASISN